MRHKVYDLKAKHFSLHQTPTALKSRTSGKKLNYHSDLSEVFFKVNIPKRKSEVLTQQQKEVLKIDRLNCANMWSL